MWAVLCARLVLPNRNKKLVKQFPPSVKKVMIANVHGHGRITVDVPDGITTHLMRECRGNVHDRRVVGVTCGSFEKETEGANPHSGAYGNSPRDAAKNAADLETDSVFMSRYRTENFPPMRNNWLCSDFKERRIVPTHYTIRTCFGRPGDFHLKSWLVETSVDGKNWREVAREEDNNRLNGGRFAGTFAGAGGGECRFIRLVNIGRNHWGSDCLDISAWEIFGSLIDSTADSTDFSDVTSLPFLSAASFGSFPAFRQRAVGQEDPHRRAEALVTHGRHRISRRTSPTEKRWEPTRTRRSPPAPRL
jgi:hypothetical protein